MRGAWLALALSLNAAGAGAQPAPPQGQTRADQAIDARLRLVADTLREAAERLGGPDAADWPAIRRAVAGAQAMLSDLPADPGQEGALGRARTALAEAHAALEVPEPDRARTGRELHEAAEAVGGLRPGLGTITPQRP